MTRPLPLVIDALGGWVDTFEHIDRPPRRGPKTGSTFLEQFAAGYFVEVYFREEGCRRWKTAISVAEEHFGLSTKTVKKSLSMFRRRFPDEVRRIRAGESDPK